VNFVNLGLRFYLFAISTALSGLVTHCVRFAISWLAVEKTGSATIAATIFSANIFVEVYARPLLAPIADYFVRLKVYRVCLMLNAAFILALLIAVAEFSFSAWLVGSLLALSSLISALRDSTAAGMTPSIVSLERMTEAQSIRSAISTTIGVLAPALAGLLIAWSGVSAALLFAAWAATLACAVSFGVKVLPKASQPKDGSLSNYLATWHLHIFDGIRAVFKTRAEMLNAAATAFLNGGLYPFFAIGIALWVNKELRYGAWAMGVIEVAFWAGMFLAGTLLLKPLNQQYGRYMTTTLSCFTLGGSLILASQCKNIMSISACLILAGMAFTAFNVNTSALRSAAAPPEFRSRMFAGVSFLASSFNPFSTIVLGAVISTSSPSTGIAACGSLIALSGIVIFKNREAQSLYTKPLDEIGAAYSSLYPDAFRQR
jgi:DHA3 family macrolide efflux protein-like MFS transporter